MRLNKQKVFRTALVGYFLASTFILSGAAFANTEASEEVSTVPSTTHSEKAVSSFGPELPTLNSSKEDVPTASTQKVEEPKRELTYEDNQMLEEPKADSPVPAVHFQEKQLENGLTIKGSVSAGEEVRENVPSQTILSALILQRLTEAGTWQEVHRFSIEESGVNATDSAFSFDYEKPVTETGESNYRLAADYTVKYSEEDQEQQKASLEVGSVTKAKEEVQEKPSETASSSQESTNSEQESTEATKGSTVESSGPKEDSNADEPIVIDPSTMGTGDDSPKTLGNNSQIPAMQNNYREAFQRGMGIMPMFSNIVTPKKENLYIGQTASYNEINEPVISAKYTSKDKVELTLRLVWKYQSYSVNNLPLSVAEATTGTDSRPYGFTIFYGGTRWGKYSINGAVKASDMGKDSGTEAEGKLKSFSNERKIRVETIGSGYVTRHAWSDNTTNVVISDIPVDKTSRFAYELNYNHHANMYIDYTFAKPQVVDLSNISTPNFTATDENTTSVDMLQGTYSGDISDDKNDGTLELWVDSVSGWIKHVTDLKHTNSKNGTYDSRKITGLVPGTLYYARVKLKDWLSAEVSSGNRVFYTPNSVNIPSVQSLGKPTNPNNATAKISATYNVGVAPAHPTAVETQVWDSTTSKWVYSGTSQAINTSTKSITYDLNGLPMRTLCYTRYRVKNASNAWSPWASTSFTTKGLKLTISPPSVDKNLTTHSQLVVKDGTYTGSITTNPTEANSGRLHYHNGFGGWHTVTTTLQHDQTLDSGGYKGMTITGLEAGTMHKLQLQLKDADGVFQRADSDTATLNTVAKPLIDSLPTPTSKYNASATISGVYGIGPAGTTPAHPDKVKVQVKLDGAPNWEDVDSSSSPKLDSQSINTSSTKGTFTISKLKASTKYHVRYQVENLGGWSDWSASEEFVTLAPPPALKIIDAPKLDFGMLQSEKFTQTAKLSAASQKNHLTVDNTDTTKGWKLTAALQQLKRTDNPSIVMPWAKLTMPINLQNSTDDGGTWSNYATGVDGIPRTMSFNSGDPAQKLWGIVNPTDAQGLFRTEIDWSNVELEVPGNQYELYEGKLVWSLDDTP